MKINKKEIIKECLKKNSKNYKHFDYPLTINQREKYLEKISNIDNLQHRYLPFIEFYLTRKKYNKNYSKIKVKKRNILLSSHHDTEIYRYFGIILNKYYYEKYVSSHGIDNVSVAYRYSKHNSNIDIAKDVFNNTVDMDKAYIFKGDFSHFFDNLNHSILEDNLKTVLGKDFNCNWKKLLKSVTKYKKVKKSNLKKLVVNKSHNSTSKSYVKNIKKLGELIRNHTIPLSCENHKGIPQGTPISAVLANVYMIKFDEKVKNILKQYNGIYRRYSDDFVILIPKKNISLNKLISLRKEIISICMKKLFLNIKEEKTKLFVFNGVNNNILSINQDNEENFNYKKGLFDYLGFIFDGHTVSMRSNSIYKFIYTGKRNIKKLAKLERNRSNNILSDEKLKNYLIKKVIVTKNDKKHTNKTYNRKLDVHEIKWYFNSIIKNINYPDNVYKSIRKGIVIRFLSLNVKKYERNSMLSYGKRAQSIFDSDNHKYNVVVEKQVKKAIIRNQILLCYLRHLKR